MKAPHEPIITTTPDRRYFVISFNRFNRAER